MPSKLQAYAQMAEQAAWQITHRYQDWTAFLTTAARLYKYPYDEQLMIYMQRPDATACAEYDFWNDRMGRYVRRGSKGIALIDTSGDKPRLRYVFDVSDTGGRENSRRVDLWELRPEHRVGVGGALEQYYGVPAANGLADQFEGVASLLAKEYWNDHRRDILGIVADSYLEEYDDYNKEATFKKAATVSIAYSLMSRCGMEPETFFEHEDFLSIFDFNTPDAVNALGTAVSQISEQVLRQIEVTVKNYEREHSAERTAEHGEQSDLYPDRGLSDPRHRTEPDAGGEPRQVRQDAEEISSGAPPDPVEQHDPLGDPVLAPAGSGADGAATPGGTDAEAGGGSGSHGEPEGQRSDAVGGPDEHLQSPGGGNHPQRADLQLTESSPVQLSLFPTEEDQIAYIEEAESVQQTPFAFSFRQEQIDHVLRLGGNSDDSRMVIASAFQKQYAMEEIAAVLQEKFHGGNGFKDEGAEYAAWYADDGIHLSFSRSAEYDRAAQVISWQDAAARIGQLMDSGEYASHVELTEAAGHEREKLAQSIWYLKRDLSDEAREQGFLSVLDDLRGGGFPDETARLAERMTDPAFLRTLAEEYAQFYEAHEQDRSLLRFHHHRLNRLWQGLSDQFLPRREYASEMAAVPALDSFITEDEINHALNRGSGVEGGKGRIYEYFTAEHSKKEKADFLKKEYGTGGRSHAVSGASHSYEDYNSKGIVLQKEGCANVEMRWPQVAERIDALIRRDRYFTPQEKARFEEWQLARAPEKEREQRFTASYSEYNAIKEAHPDDIVLFQVGDFYEMYGEDARQAAEVLGMTLTTRTIPGAGRVEMCGVPSHNLELYTDQLRDRYDVTVSPTPEHGAQRSAHTLLSIDHEAARAIDAHEAEFGADGYRAFPGHRPEAEPAEEHAPPMRTLTQEDIDEQLRTMFPDIETKRAVVRYMNEHGREKDTAAWLAEQYYGTDVNTPLHIGFAGWNGRPGDEVTLSWAKVQRRIAQLIKADKFYTQEEYDNLDDVDPIAIRERLAQAGIVNGEVVDPEALNRNPFIQQVMADAARIAQEERGDTFTTPGGVAYHAGMDVDTRSADGTMVRMHIDRVEDGYVWYTFPDMPEQEPVNVFRSRFEGWLDDGSSIIVGLEGGLPVQMGTHEERDFTPYRVGDTVYLDNTAFEITAIGSFDVQLRDPTLLYPIFRSESKERFERYLRQDERNAQFYAVEDQKTETAVSAAKNPAYKIGVMLYLDDKPYEIIRKDDWNVTLMDRSIQNPSPRLVSWDNIEQLLRQDERNAHLFNQETPEASKPGPRSETVAFYPGEKNGLPYDIEVRTLRVDEPEHEPPAPEPTPVRGAGNFRIMDDHLGEGGPKDKFWRNVKAIATLKQIENENRQATPEEQHILSQYVGWGGLPDAFDPEKPAWAAEYSELKGILTDEEYAAARASTLNAHYTSPTVIRAIYEAIGNMGFETGNVLEPAMGVGNFFGCLPEAMGNSKLYGVELDSITGRIAKQLYPKADITVAGFETTDRRDFYDLAIGNVPFGNYQVNDRAYNKLGFSIHDYFFAKTLDQVRPGGVIAFVTSRYTMDKQTPDVRKYIAQRAELLGAIRLPNNAFKANAGTDVVSDIIFLQKRDRPIDIEPDWVHLGENEDGFAINSYFVDHPEMILGVSTSESTQYGRQDFTVAPIEGADLAAQLHEAVQQIGGSYQAASLPDLGEEENIQETIPADPNVKNYSYTVVDGEVYFRENSVMVKPELNNTAKERVKGLVELRDCVHRLIDLQMWESDAISIRQEQVRLNTLYDAFTQKYGLINSRGNALAFSDDSSYYLLCSLEELDEDGNLERKADMFTKRTIKQHQAVTSVDTAAEALAVSISERARVDMEYMSQLSGKEQDELIEELTGVVFLDPVLNEWQTADEYLSGNVREKLRQAQKAAEDSPGYLPNVEALQAAQPKDLDASEIEVRLGATWIDRRYIQQFMFELLDPPPYAQRGMDVHFSEFTAEWNISGKNNIPYNNVNAYMTYGTDRANAYKILEDTLNLRDVRIYDTVRDPEGKERRVLNSEETTIAQQKQQAIKDAFRDWIWKDPDRRRDLVQTYNERFNSMRPREYDGKHLTFPGMNPEITLRDHQLNAIAHDLYGANTLLAHEVGAGKTFEMVAAAMESKRLGLCHKSLFAVPNHLAEQWASEFLRLYPSANILVATKKDFEKRNRKKFCARIATGDYDAVIIGHSQFERIPVSVERQERLLWEQINEVEDGLRELKASNAERFSVKELERTKKNLEAKLEKLQDTDRKDDVVTFEQLGVDRLYVDEAHSFKNLFLYTKMRNVAGLSTTDAQKSSDMLLKCRYIDEITGGKGVTFATGTPVSNSMTELYTMMRYLQHGMLRRNSLTHFDCWASAFGETTTAIELAPEGTGYRARTRFARFFNLPELMNLFREAADIKTADQLNLPTPTPIYHTEVAQPTEIQKEMVKELSERAAEVHAGHVKPNEDNMLKITSDGRKLGLDQRVINPDLPDDPNSKVNMCVNNIYRIWEEGQPEKLTQLVFCDLSTPRGRTAQSGKIAAKRIDNAELHALETAIDAETEPEEPPFTIYDDIREKLVARGVPREQIAYIHEANTDARKKELFSKVRSGQVRVLMGSTFKMGAGMNVQDRLVALHDLDCPWRPGDLEQRSGRIIRQGNKNKEVHIYRYVTEGTFDAYLWQTVENKQKFISQIMTSKSPVRSCEDIDEAALSYAEIKALCAGDERIKEKMDLDVDVARLRLMKANHQSQQYRLEDNILRNFPAQIEQHKGCIAWLAEDIKKVAEHPHPKDGFAGMEVKGDHLIDKDNAGAALLEAFKDAKGLEAVHIGSYRGFDMSLTIEDFGSKFVLTLKGEMSHRVELGKDARGNLTRIDNALAAIPERVQMVQEKLENVQRQLSMSKAELGKPFPQEQELQEKSARLAQLNAELNIDDRIPIERASDTVVAKSARPSVLEKLKVPRVSGRQEKKKSHELEVL